MPVILGQKKAANGGFNYSFVKMAAGGIALASTAYLWDKKSNLLPPVMGFSNMASCDHSADEVQELRSAITKFVEGRRNMAPLLIRLSWHDAGTYDKKSNSGGPRACMRQSGGEADHGANAGL